VVFCYRDYHLNMQSFAKKTGRKAEHFRQHWRKSFQAITRWDGPVFFARFENVLKDPKPLIDFCKGEE